MIPASLTANIAAYQATVTASKPIAELTPLQLAALVEQGLALVGSVDAALTSTGTGLDASEPTGHPLTMIADVRRRREASADAATLSDLRGYLGRAVLNLSQGSA